MMKDAMPSTVLIGSVTYLVTVDPDDWLRVEHETFIKGCYGHTNHYRATIYVDPKLTPDVQRQTLWHEVLHALAEAVMGSPDWRGLGTEKDDREEAVVRIIESPTMLVLRDNPDLVKYLTSRR